MRITPRDLQLNYEDDEVAGVGGTVKLSRVLPDAHLVIVKGAGHGVSSHDPEALGHEIDELAARLR